MHAEAFDVRMQRGLTGPTSAILRLLDRFPGWILPGLYRISVGAIFWNAGLTKIGSWPTTLALFRDEYHVPLIPPELAAYLATAVELACPVLLVLGLFTRLATLPMLAQTLVIAVFVYPENWIDHLTWSSLLLSLLVLGPGALSLDNLLERRRGRV